jgi:hypothetical protein
VVSVVGVKGAVKRAAVVVVVVVAGVGLVGFMKGAPVRNNAWATVVVGWVRVVSGGLLVPPHIPDVQRLARCTTLDSPLVAALGLPCHRCAQR